MARRVIGLDIKHDAIAAVSVKTGFRGNSIDAYVYAPIPESDDGLALALETVSGALPIEGAVCIASVPAGDVSFRNLTVPFSHPKKIRQILPYELEQTLPASAEEFAIDFHRVLSGGGGGESDIVVGSVELSSLGHYLDRLRSAGFQMETVTPGGYSAAVWSLKHLPFGESGLMLDVGVSDCTLYIIVSKEIRFIRTFPVSAHPGTYGASLCADILRTVAAFEEMFSIELEPEGVLISGMASDDMSLHQEISKGLELAVQSIDVIESSEVQIKGGLRETWNPMVMNNALSMALTELDGTGGFDFLATSFSEKRMWKEHGKRLMVSGALALFVTLLAMFNLLYETHGLQKQSAVLDQKMRGIFKETFPDVRRIVDPLHQMKIKIGEKKRGGLYGSHGNRSVRLIDMLNDISRLIPPNQDVELNRIVTGPETLQISGSTDTFNTVNDIKTRLERAESFQSVTINSATIEKSGNRVRFKLKVEL